MAVRFGGGLMASQGAAEDHGDNADPVTADNKL
jgi:hypothetical protein